MSKDTLTAIRMGRDYLAENVWQQHGYFGLDAEGFGTDRTRCCALGAVCAALDLEPISSGDLLGGVADQLAGTLAEMGLYADIVTYNDDAGRTKDEVLAVFDKTIERLST